MLEEKRLNPIAQRTRRLIMDALLDLMREMPFKDITVKQIMYRADLVRRTFYGHFSSKEEVLQAYLDEIFADYLKEVTRFERMEIYLLAKTLFDFCLLHRDYFTLLKQHDLFISIKQLEKYLLLITSSLELEGWDKLQGEMGEYATAYFAGGFLNLISRWVDEGMQRSPQEMGAISVQLVGTLAID